MRGAHRDIWCSKNTPLIEAELFAVESCRPAPSGRALLCAAPYARKIQGSSATYKRKDARNRAPVTPVSLHISDVSAQRKVWGVKRGQETIGVLSPFVSAARRRHPRPPKAATVHAHLERKVASGGGYTVRRRYRDKKPLQLGRTAGADIVPRFEHTLLRREGKNRSSNRKQLMNLCPPLAYDATRFGRK